MIFEQDYTAFELFDVLKIEQEHMKYYNKGRNFDALSFRYKAHTVLETENSLFELGDYSICFVPANINYTRVTDYEALTVVHLKLLNRRASDIECITPQDHEKYAALFDQLLSCRTRMEAGYKNECAALVSRIFAELYKDSEKERSITKIDAGVEYIEKQCLHRDFKLSKAAARSYMSETYFRKLFKETYGISPKQAVLERRIDHARSLILAGYFSIKEISELCGFNDSKHFSVEFKRLTGTSPSEYIYNFPKERM